MAQHWGGSGDDLPVHPRRALANGRLRMPEDALKGIRKVVRDALRDMQAEGEKAPEPLSTKVYSGQLRVRIPPALHRELAIEAAEQNRSLNRVIINRLAHG